MLRLMLIGAQVAGIEPAAPPRSLDLHVVERCPVAEEQSGEIIVCGARNSDRFCVKALPGDFERSSRPKAEVALGNAKLGATTQQVMIGGIPSNRIMVSVKIPF